MYARNNQRVVATIEARMTSSRLPGKVLLPLAGRPALERLVERIRRSCYVDDIVVATTINNEDMPIIDLCEKIGCSYFRGSEEDVLSRVLGAAESVNGDIIVEITGDCPLLDHRHIDKMIELFYSGECDYANMKNVPNGFGVQVFPTKILGKVDTLTDDPIDRVHVSCYIYNHPETFRLFHWHAEGDMNWPEGRVTLDEQSDYELLNAIVEELYPKNKDFSAEDVVRFLKSRPDLVAINAEVRQKEIQEG